MATLKAALEHLREQLTSLSSSPRMSAEALIQWKKQKKELSTDILINIIDLLAKQIIFVINAKLLFLRKITTLTKYIRNIVATPTPSPKDKLGFDDYLKHAMNLFDIKLKSEKDYSLALCIKAFFESINLTDQNKILNEITGVVNHTENSHVFNTKKNDLLDSLNDKIDQWLLTLHKELACKIASQPEEEKTPQQLAVPANSDCPLDVWASKAQEDFVRPAIVQITREQSELAGTAALQPNSKNSILPIEFKSNINSPPLIPDNILKECDERMKKFNLAIEKITARSNFSILHSDTFNNNQKFFKHFSFCINFHLSKIKELTVDLNDLKNLVSPYHHNPEINSRLTTLKTTLSEKEIAIISIKNNDLPFFKKITEQCQYVKDQKEKLENYLIKRASTYSSRDSFSAAMTCLLGFFGFQQEKIKRTKFIKELSKALDCYAEQDNPAGQYKVAELVASGIKQFSPRCSSEGADYHKTLQFLLRDMERKFCVSPSAAQSEPRALASGAFRPEARG